jgi:peroxiredoxin
MKKENTLPDFVFKTRVRDESIEGPNPYRWEDKTTADYFGGKRVILFGLPGAFTPTCSNFQLPRYEEMYSEFQEYGVDAIYCLSVNDAFVMNAWAKSLGIEKVEMIPDGTGQFTSMIGMAVKKDNLGFGKRSWRFATVINDRKVEMHFPEASIKDDIEDDPYEISKPENLIMWFKSPNRD